MTLLEIFTRNPDAVAMRNAENGAQVRVSRNLYGCMSIRRRADASSEWELTNWHTDDLGDTWMDVTPAPAARKRAA